jgi:hypothetical protein
MGRQGESRNTMMRMSAAGHRESAGMFALGLFARVAACPIVVFLIVTNHERWRVGGLLEQDGPRIHADVDRGRHLFPGARRWRDLLQ